MKLSGLFFGGVFFAAGLLLSAHASANGGGSEAGNGGGLAEKNLTFAYLNLDSYLDLCLGTPLCQLTPVERELLARIRAATSQERSHPSQLAFRSEKKEPGFFMIDGQIRVAKTGDHVGDPIYLNSDLLYSVTAPGDYRALQIPMAVSILVHELGHHQGNRDHAALDVLGTKVQTLALLQSQRSEFWNGSAALVTFQLNWVKRDADKKTIHLIDSMVLEYGDELVTLNDRIAQNVHCPKAADKILGLRLYNVHEERGVTFDAATQLIRKPLVAWYILSCVSGQESDHGNLSIELVFHKQSGGRDPLYQPELTRVQQVSCSVDSKACK